MPVSRRVFLRMLGLAVAGEALSGCIMCYAPATPTPTKPAGSQDLNLQAELLTEMADQSGLEAETVSRARAAVRRDVAFLARSEGGK